MKWFLAGILLLPLAASADIVISEIMYDLEEGSDSGREWIEVKNTGTSAIDLSKWKIIENGKAHAIKALGDAFVQPGIYTIVADNPEKFKMDNPAYSGLLFDSAFALNNSGESIGLAEDREAIADTVAYASSQGGNGTGDSLQRKEQAFAPGLPTPGAGIPAGGLVQKAPKQKSAKKQPSIAGGTQAAPEFLGSDEAQPGKQLFVAARATQSSAILWWLAPFLIACAGSIGIVWSRHLKKDEWEIIEAQE